MLFNMDGTEKPKWKSERENLWIKHLFRNGEKNKTVQIEIVHRLLMNNFDVSFGWRYLSLVV